MKKSIIILFFITLFWPTICLANANYTIDKYDVTISLKQNNVLEYEENLDLTFSKYNTEIIKQFPSNSQNIFVNNSYSTEPTAEKILHLDSGHNVNMPLKTSYTLNYNNSANLITIELGNSYNADIKKTNFIINLPSAVVKDNITFYLDNQDITAQIKYTINGSTIQGSFNEILTQNATLKMAIQYNHAFFNFSTIMLNILPLILTLISYLIWLYYGKDLKLKISKITTLPKDLTPLDLALVQNEKVTTADCFTLLLHLANKGYIKITEIKNHEFLLDRIKDYDGDNEQEALFIKLLFRQNTHISLSEYIDVLTNKSLKTPNLTLDKKVTDKDLLYKYKIATNNILSLLNNDKEKSQYYELISNRKKNYLIMFIAIILLLITSVPFLTINTLYLLPISVIFSIILLKILLTFVDKIDYINLNKNKTYKQTLLGIIIIIILISTVILLPTFKRNLLYLSSFIISIISTIIILILYKFMPKRTKYGAKIYSKMVSLKLYLNTCSKEDMLNLLKNNSNYLYDLLPYSYILGCQLKIFNLLKDHNIKKPTWYNVMGNYSVIKLNHSLTRLERKLTFSDEELY